MLDAAVSYASRGWPVFPLWPSSKRPVHKGGFHNATTEIDRVQRWWTDHPDDNIGVRCGDKFDVVDIDGDEGFDSIDNAAPGEATLTGPMAFTSKGMHIYLAKSGLPRRIGVLTKVDFLGRGGFVIAPPSRHPSGAAYEWCDDRGPDTPLHGLPGWLRELVSPPAPIELVAKPVRPSHTARSSDPYGQAALEREVGRVATAPVGRRNEQLNRSAFSLAQLVAAGRLDDRTVIGELLIAATRCGLPEGEAASTIVSGVSAGYRRPRRAS